MNLRVLLASALLLPACAAQRASTTPTPAPEPSAAPAPSASVPVAQGTPVAPPTGLQQQDGPIGTPHPFIFQAAATDGRWVVACQAREDSNGDGKVEVRYGQHGDTSGDALAPYLFLDPGAGERLDDFLTADPTDRYLVVVRGGSLRLLDTYTRQDTELAPPGGFPDSTTPASPLPVSFSQDGRRLLVMRSGPDKKLQAVLLHLEDGSRHEVPHGPGELGQASLWDDGTWAEFGVLTQDTDGDGTLTWPLIRTSLSPRFCRGPIRSYSRYGYDGDKPSLVVRRVSGGPILQADDILRPLGDSLLRRDEQGELFVEDASGQRTPWVPASCQGTILHVDVEREQLLVACTARGNALELHGAQVHLSLGLSVEPASRDLLSGEPTLLFPVTPAATAEGTRAQSVVDLEKRTVHPIPVPGEVRYTEGTRALVFQYTGPERQTYMRWFVDVGTGEQRELGEQEGYKLKVAGPFVYAPGLLVDMRTGQRVGTVDGDVAALDSRGRVLRPGSDREPQAPLGPFQWTSVATPR